MIQALVSRCITMYHSLLIYYGMIHRDTNTLTFFQCQDMAHVSCVPRSDSWLMRPTFRLMAHASRIESVMRPALSPSWLMAHVSRLMAHGSCVQTHGSWLTCHASCVRLLSRDGRPCHVTGAGSWLMRHASDSCHVTGIQSPHASCVRRHGSWLMRQTPIM